MDKSVTMPFLKWPGGKRWLTQKIINKMPKIEGKYIEPFLGGGALFFALQPSNATISDINSELIETYMIMRDHPKELREKMLYHQRHHCKEYYYKMRATRPRTSVNRAGRFLYLNRTCFNGMYRVNGKGEFNVPKGSKDYFINDIDMFEKYAKVLRNIEIQVNDFSVIIDSSNSGDFIFADPPYAMNNGTQFVKYNDELFTWDDQKRLFYSLQQAYKRGVHIVLTNVFCEEIEKMYRDAGFYVTELVRSCSISGKVSKRQKVKELLISSYNFNELETKDNEENSCIK